MLMKKAIGLLLLCTGVFLIAFPFYKEWEQNKEVKALEEALSLISESGNEEVDLAVIENLTLSKKEVENVLELEIPFIDMKQYVLDETTDENLNIALTQIKQNQTPGIGNFTIAGHRGYRDGRHFSNLAKVPVGEAVYLHTKEATYIYEVQSSTVIEATHIEVLEDTPGKDELTLITCTVSGAERVAVKGNLKEVVLK